MLYQVPSLNKAQKKKSNFSPAELNHFSYHAPGVEEIMSAIIIDSFPCSKALLGETVLLRPSGNNIESLDVWNVCKILPHF